MNSDNTKKTKADNNKKPFSKRWSFVFFNLIAMLLFVIACFVGIIIYLNDYTRHGQEVEVPNVKGLTISDATSKLGAVGFYSEVSDSVYIKTIPSGVVYDQSISSGSKIKSGRTILLTINSNTPPQLVLPDIADNSSLREAKMRLKAQGFKIGLEKFIPGEKDWVYEVQVNGRTVAAGTRVGVEETITLLVGDGSLYTDDMGNDFDPDTMSLDEPYIPE